MIRTRSSRLALLSAGIACILPLVPAHAMFESEVQPVEADDLQAADDVTIVQPASGDIIVTAARGPSSVQSDIPADQVLDETAIASYGAANASELVAALAVQTRSNRGRGGGFPVILVNGRRVSGFGEIRNLPSEAIARVEIFPEEVAIDYGYSPDQRVVNFILKDNFSAITTELDGGAATDGGRGLVDAEASLLRLRGRSRVNLTANYQHQAALTEDDRDIIQADPAGNGELRTLLPRSDTFSIDGTIARPLSTRTGASLNLRYDQTLSQSLLGESLADPGEPLIGRNRSQNWRAGASSDGRLGTWRWSLTGSYENARLRASSERNVMLAPGTLVVDRTRTSSQTADLDAVLSGRLFALPAGAVRMTVQSGWRDISFDATSLRSGVTTVTDLSRTALTASSNIDVPIASRNDNVLAFIGDLSANGRIALRDVSDFRTLTSWTAGLNWGPADGLNVILTWLGEESAPSVTQLGAPALVTTGRTIYDFTRAETVLADIVTGGNPLLNAERRNDFRLQTNWRPISSAELLLTASYARTISRNTTADFPLITPEIEAAFPGRVTRGMDGRITSVDQRPVNYERTEGRQIRYGVNFSKPFGQSAGGGMFGRMMGGGARPPAAAGATPPAPSAPPPVAGTTAPTPPATAPAAPPAAGVPPRGPMGGMGRGPGGGMGRGGFGGMMGGPSGGRWSVGLFHTIRLQDDILIRQGLPVLDLLDGSATGSNGGTPRHTVEMDGGWFFRGMGVRVIGNWREGSTVVGGPVAGGGTASNLTFSPQMTINLRMFMDLNQRPGLVENHPVFRNSRIRLAIDNLFNDRQTVRDANGIVPLRYQQGYLDPAGRTFALEFRKQF